MNAAKNNAILLVPGTNGNRHSYDFHIGSGKTFDTDKYFVIGADPIGKGTSSQPKVTYAEIPSIRGHSAGSASAGTAEYAH